MTTEAREAWLVGSSKRCKFQPSPTFLEPITRYWITKADKMETTSTNAGPGLIRNASNRQHKEDSLMILQESESLR